MKDTNSETQQLEEQMADILEQPPSEDGSDWLTMTTSTNSTIAEGAYHPAADSAMAWLKGYMVQHSREYLMHKEALASTALAGNRLAEICLGTIDRLAKGEPVSDRYLLGLAWTIMKLSNHDEMEQTESMRIDGLN